MHHLQEWFGTFFRNVREKCQVQPVRFRWGNAGVIARFTGAAPVFSTAYPIQNRNCGGGIRSGKRGGPFSGSAPCYHKKTQVTFRTNYRTRRFFFIGIPDSFFRCGTLHRFTVKFSVWIFQSSGFYPSVHGNCFPVSSRPFCRRLIYRKWVAVCGASFRKGFRNGAGFPLHFFLALSEVFSVAAGTGFALLIKPELSAHCSVNEVAAIPVFSESVLEAFIRQKTFISALKCFPFCRKIAHIVIFYMHF